MPPRRRARGTEEGPQDELLPGVEWVRQHFTKALYKGFRDPDGKPNYLKLTKEQGEGYSLYELVPVHTLAKILIESVPDFQTKPPEEVAASLKMVDAEQGYGFGPLLKRLKLRPKEPGQV